MAPLVENDPLYGDPSMPRKTSDLKERKNCLTNGMRIALRKDNQ